MSQLSGWSGGVGVLFVRRALLVLVGFGIVATAFELAAERHWNSPTQLIPWFTLAVLAFGVTLALRVGRRSTRAVRILAVVVLLVALYGVVEHAVANHSAGGLDQRYADVWETLPAVTQWWYAVTKTVGSAPMLAPGVLAQQGLLLLLVSWIRPGTE